MSKEALRNALVDAAMLPALGCPVVYPNTGEISADMPSAELWARVNYLLGEPTQIGLGENGYHRTDGEIRFSFFAPKGEGDLNLYKKADVVESALPPGASLTFNGTTIRVKNVATEQGAEEERYEALLVKVYFYHCYQRS